MKKAVIVVSYNEESELNTFLSQNDTYLEVTGIHEEVDEVDVEKIQDILIPTIVE